MKKAGLSRRAASALMRTLTGALSIGIFFCAISAFADIVAVGWRSPDGDGRWGQHDLAGSVYEWTLDWYDGTWYSGGGFACADCANVAGSGSGRDGAPCSR